MRNPYRELATPRLENPQGEGVEGSFSCQTSRCYDVVGEARYLEEIQVLTWKCSKGHINRIEDFKIV